MEKRYFIYGVCTDCEDVYYNWIEVPNPTCTSCGGKVQETTFTELKAGGYDVPTVSC